MLSENRLGKHCDDWNESSNTELDGRRETEVKFNVSIWVTVVHGKLLDLAVIDGNWLTHNVVWVKNSKITWSSENDSGSSVGGINGDRAFFTWLKGKRSVRVLSIEDFIAVEVLTVSTLVSGFTVRINMKLVARFHGSCALELALNVVPWIWLASFFIKIRTITIRVQETCHGINSLTIKTCCNAGLCSYITD